jgi:alpha-ketoglutarate-dependent taurine dioxygenase
MNAYGPAECADDVAMHRISSAPGDDVAHIPIGRALPELRLYVLCGDDLAPTFVPGELCVAGIGVGRGYLCDPERTAEVFVPDPFSIVPGARMYRTGDVARRLPNGEFVYVGRRDQQVKLRGFRIELGEIESCLVTHQDVSQAVVVVQEGDHDKRLNAYVVAKDPSGPPTPEVLSRHLRSHLPEYMMPSAFVFLPALPLNPNGKIDRAALPQPQLVNASAHVAPRTPTEEILVGIWCEVLRCAAAGTRDNFFELGGHSLLATQVISRVRRAFEVELPLRTIFESPTISALAREIDCLGEDGASEQPLLPVPRDQPLPLSFAQQRLWFLSELEPDNTAYNMSLAVRVTGELDGELLGRSLAELVQRHEMLRTVFMDHEGEPLQRVEPTAAPELEQVDLSVERDDQRAALERAAHSRVNGVFNLRTGPLVRLTSFKLNPGEHVLLLVLHHIIADGWSLGSLIAELAENYEAARESRATTLAPLPIQYADFAVWQRRWMEPRRERQLAYWKRQLLDAPELNLRPEHPRGELPERAARHDVSLDSEVTGVLRLLAQREGATLFMVLLALYNITLMRRSGQRDLLVGTDVANRQYLETEALIGFFVNLLVLRSDLGGNPSFRELLVRVRQTALAAYAHQDLPFEEVVDAVRDGRGLNRSPLVSTLFVLQNTASLEINLQGLRLSPEQFEWEQSRFDLGVFVEETDEGLTLAWKYRANLFEPATVVRMAREFVSLAKAIVANPDERLSALMLGLDKEHTAGLRAKLQGPRRLVSRKSELDEGALVSTQLSGSASLPVILSPAVSDVKLAAWVATQRESVEGWLLRHGAVLFRGFGLRAVSEFEAVAQSITGDLFGDYGDLPRENSSRYVYGATPYPPNKSILFHNESSHLPRWPLHQWFFCVRPSVEGGATPIVDCRRVYHAIPVEIRDKFERVGLRYTRNFIPGYDVSWKLFFHTEDKRVVEERCRAEGMEFSWGSGDILRLSHRAPAVLSHPRTREAVFFGQIQLHHPAYLEESVQRSLQSMVGERQLPRNVTYGDGTPIEADAIRAIATAYDECAARFVWREGDLLLLDNMLTAHGRDPYRGARKIVVAMGRMQNRTEIEGSES